MGPGKADLLEAVTREGSISAAARALGMSYRRAWLLVDQMNRCFTLPLVETQAGGGRQAGARLTDEGQAALAAYRALSAQVEKGAQGAAFQALDAALRGRPAPTHGTE
jgi:molybdate transport system regulatory protein